MHQFTVVFSIVAVWVSTLSAQSTDVPFGDPPSLNSVFLDRFETDTRGNYGVEDEKKSVEWRPGELKLAEGASLQCDSKGGAWFEWHLNVKHDGLSGSGSKCSFELLLELQDAPDTSIRMTQILSNGKIVNQVSLIDDSFEPNYVAATETSSIEIDEGYQEWKITYRYGLWSIHHPVSGRTRFLVTANDGHSPDSTFHSAANVATWRLRAVGNPLYVSKMETKCSRFTRLSQDQSSVIEEAREATQTFIRLYRQRDFQQAEERTRSTLSMLENTIGRFHPFYSQNEDNLAAVLIDTRKLPGAAEVAKRGLELRAKVLGKDHPRYADSLMSRAVIQLYQGEFDRAEKNLLLCIEIRRKTLGTRHAGYAEGLSNLSGLYLRTGLFKKAQPLLLESLKVQEPMSGANFHEYANSLNMLAMTHFLLGSYDQAEPLLIRCKKIYEDNSAKDHPGYAAALHALGGLYLRMQDPVKAEELMKKTVELRKKIFGDNHPVLAVSLNNLAGCYRDMGDFEKSLELMLKSLEIREKTLGNQHPEYVATLHNLADIYSKLGQTEKAEELFTIANDTFEKILGPDHPDFGTSLESMGVFFKNQDELEKARQLVQRANEIYKLALGEKHIKYRSSLATLAELEFLLEDKEKAKERIEQVMEIDKFNQERFSIIESQSQQLKRARTNSDTFGFYMSVISGTEQDELVGAFEHYLSFRGTVMARQRLYRVFAEENETSEIFSRLQLVASQLRQHLERYSANAEWETQRKMLKQKLENMEAELAAKSGQAAARLDRINLRTLMAEMPEHRVLLCFVSHDFWRSDEEDKMPNSEKRMAVFVVQSGADIKMVDLGATSRIESEVRAWRETTGASSGSRAAGKNLRKLVWEPIAKHLDQKTEIVISPDHCLNYFPFQALPGSKDESYLIENFEFSYLPTPALFQGSTNVSSIKPDRELLLLGGIDYDFDGQTIAKKKRRVRSGPANPFLTKMRFDSAITTTTASEVDSIRGTFEGIFEYQAGDVMVLKGTAATEAAFRQKAGDFHNLHIATHGFFINPEVDQNSDVVNDRSLFSSNDKGLATNPGLMSGLALAGANKSSEAVTVDDGVLTAQEISYLPLSGVGLVVLSACETGLGVDSGNDGLLGLQRAFQIAGAKTTVASLWKVDDLAAKELMIRFYRNHWENDLSPAAAMRETQLWLLNNPSRVRGFTQESQTDTKSNRTPPFYWAPWVVSGDWN